MSGHRKTRAGNKVRVDLQRPGFLIPAPDAPWIECVIVEVSDEGVCLEVGSRAVPKIFGLAFTATGEVFRACRLNWRNGERVGARFVSAEELRGILETKKAQSKIRKSYRLRHIPQRHSPVSRFSRTHSLSVIRIKPSPVTSGPLE